MDAASTRTVADNRYKVLIAICISAVIIPLVFTGPAISIPSVARDLGGDQVSLGWIVNAYAIAFGGCVMAAGALGDQIGRKRCFVTGLVIFAVTSVLIGLTPSLLVLNLLRALEGIGGALVLTSATSLLAQEFEDAERTRAFSFLGTAFGVGLAFGPMASGFVIEHWDWRALYFAIAIISILILVLGTPRIRESRDPDAQGIDWPGTILFTAALVGLTFAIVLGRLVPDLRRSPERLEFATGDRRDDQAHRRVQAGGGADCTDQRVSPRPGCIGFGDREVDAGQMGVTVSAI